MTRSRSAGSGSSWARSRPCWPPSPAWPRPPSRSAKTSQETNGWPGTSSPNPEPAWTRPRCDAAHPGASRLHGARCGRGAGAVAATAASKLDRRALPAPDYAAAAGTFQAPATATEQALCELFAHVLGIGQVGVNDSFFDLGGHSLLAAMLVARLAEQLSIKITLKAFMGNPTVRAINRYLAQ